MSVPQEITHTFGSKIQLVHPVTNAKIEVPLSFEARSSGGMRVSTHRPSPTPTPQREIRGESTSEGETKKNGHSLLSIFMMFAFGFAMFCFVLVNFFKMDPVVSYSSI